MCPHYGHEDGGPIVCTIKCHGWRLVSTLLINARTQEKDAPGVSFSSSPWWCFPTTTVRRTTGLSQTGTCKDQERGRTVLWWCREKLHAAARWWARKKKNALSQTLYAVRAKSIRILQVVFLASVHPSYDFLKSFLFGRKDARMRLPSVRCSFIHRCEEEEDSSVVYEAIKERDRCCLQALNGLR